MKFNKAFDLANKKGMSIRRIGWGLRAVCYVNSGDFILENYSDDTKRILMLTYEDIVAKDWEVCDRDAVRLMKAMK